MHWPSSRRLPRLLNWKLASSCTHRLRLLAHRLVVELDGGVHLTQAKHDEDRRRELGKQDYPALRLLNSQVEEDSGCAGSDWGCVRARSPSSHTRA